ncbi:fungal-specific transcription factor domain-containing protein [Xylariaceae sp. FL0255]|nr:fungal-specific transcription factor domain-containing protein [Xylariaceae sp. FL0255]
MSGKACGTCRDRKLSCDRVFPSCDRCSRSGLTCRGYQIRLSWPREVDRKRFIVGRPPPKGGRPGSRSVVRLINTSFRDIQMYHARALLTPTIIYPSPGPFQRLRPGSKEPNLLQYFHFRASQFLAIFGCNSKYVGQMLMRMALIDDSPSATAILHSMLAISSLHCYGRQAQVGELKLSAIRALKQSSNNSSIGSKEWIRHIAAVMVLCSIEACTADEWAPYICSVKNIIRAGQLASANNDSDFQTLVDWGFVFDTLGFFSMSHWSRVDKSPAADLCVGPAYRPAPHMKVFGLLKDISAAVQIKSSKKRLPEEQEEFIKYLQILEFKVSNILRSITPLDDDPNSLFFVELFIYALLVYLGRSTSDLLPELKAKTDQRIERAFSIFPKLTFCDRKFPLFVLGCEARTEEDRAMFLDLVSRTQDRSLARPLSQIEALVKTSWAQSDLADHKDSEVDYLDKISTLIRGCRAVPSFD